MLEGYPLPPLERDTMGKDTHTLTVFNAVDVPEDVQLAVMSLLASYDPDIYQRPCDAQGKTA